MSLARTNGMVTSLVFRPAPEGLDSIDIVLVNFVQGEEDSRVELRLGSVRHPDYAQAMLDFMNTLAVLPPENLTQGSIA